MLVVVFQVHGKQFSENEKCQGEELRRKTQKYDMVFFFFNKKKIKTHPSFPNNNLIPQFITFMNWFLFSSSFSLLHSRIGRQATMAEKL